VLTSANNMAAPFEFCRVSAQHVLYVQYASFYINNSGLLSCLHCANFIRNKLKMTDFGQSEPWHSIIAFTALWCSCWDRSYISDRLAQHGCLAQFALCYYYTTLHGCKCHTPLFTMVQTTCTIICQKNRAFNPFSCPPFYHIVWAIESPNQEV
jgi:hypothetical protein